MRVMQNCLPRGGSCLFSVLVGTSLLLGASQADAGQLVYKPINPNFGGNPFIGDFLINNATIQNQNVPSDGGDSGGIQFPDLSDLDTIILDGLDDGDQSQDQGDTGNGSGG